MRSLIFGSGIKLEIIFLAMYFSREKHAGVNLVKLAFHSSPPCEKLPSLRGLQSSQWFAIIAVVPSKALRQSQNVSTEVNPLGLEQG